MSSHSLSEIFHTEHETKILKITEFHKPFPLVNRPPSFRISSILGSHQCNPENGALFCLKINSVKSAINHTSSSSLGGGGGGGVVVVVVVVVAGVVVGVVVVVAGVVVVVVVIFIISHSFTFSIFSFLHSSFSFFSFSLS